MGRRPQNASDTPYILKRPLGWRWGGVLFFPGKFTPKFNELLRINDSEFILEPVERHLRVGTALALTLFIEFQQGELKVKRLKKPSDLATIVASGLSTGYLRRAGLMLILTATAGGMVPTAHAEETTTEKVNTEANKGKKETKRNWRQTKRAVRNATGNEDKKQDFKDAGKNAKDEVEYQGKKVKDKMD